MVSTSMSVPSSLPFFNICICPFHKRVRRCLHTCEIPCYAFEALLCVNRYHSMGREDVHPFCLEVLGEWSRLVWSNIRRSICADNTVSYLRRPSLKPHALARTVGFSRTFFSMASSVNNTSVKRPFSGFSKCPNFFECLIYTLTFFDYICYSNTFFFDILYCLYSMTCF